MKQWFVKMNKIKILFFISLVFLGIVLFPIRNILFSNSFIQKSLFVFTNEAEIRPCGGFVTAFGEGRLFPPSFEIKNSYDLVNFDFGKNEYPLLNISKRKKFWDLGYDSDLEKCSNVLLDSYNTYFNKDIKNIFLVNFSVVEGLIEVLNISKSKDFFAIITREVANIDRHDEEVLLNRKSVLKKISSKLIQNIWFKFWKWPVITSYIADSVKKNDIYGNKIKKKSEILDKNDFSVIEWNLGGGKSSRLLKKVFHLSFREKNPGNWDIKGQLEVKNLSGFDEPIGQYWKGIFEIVIPEYIGFEFETQKSDLLQKNSFLIETKIAPGETFLYDFEFLYTGDINNISFFNQRGQDIFLDLDISVYPQKGITAAKNLEVKTNTALFFDRIKKQKNFFSWEIIEDKEKPFLSFHQKVKYENIPKEFKDIFHPDDFIVEIHFNEKVNIKNGFMAKLLDRNYHNKDIKEDLYFVNKFQTQDKTALYIIFYQEKKQLNERFYIELKGVEDFFGNKIQKAKNTIIER